MRANTGQTAVMDGQRPSQLNMSALELLGEGFFIVISLIVAVVNAANGGITPIDDLDIPLSIDIGAASDRDFTCSRLALV